MKRQFAFPDSFKRLFYACGTFLLILAGSTSAIAASNSDACALLKPTDLTGLLGGKVTAKNNAGSCAWTASGSKKKLIAVQYKKSDGVPVEMVYMGARQNAPQTGKVTDESRLGDKAFSVIDKAGMVVLMIIKNGRLVQFQYRTGTVPTAKDVDALKPITKKAIAAF
jgi:hypothetical protein